MQAFSAVQLSKQKGAISESMYHKNRRLCVLKSELKMTTVKLFE